MSWVGPSEPEIDEDNVYRTLVVDSGPIIRRTGLTSLRGRAKTYYTVPAVMQEIRDAKAREHLSQLPFELIARDPTKEGTKAVIEFSKKTGDFQSLSTVDLQVLALLYDLEQEGCGDMSHVRKIPKRTVGVGKIQSLAKKEEKKEEEQKSGDAPDVSGDAPDADVTASVEKPSFFEAHEVDIVDDSDDDEEEYSEDENEMEESLEQAPKAAAPKSWAALLNPNAGSSSVPIHVASSPAKIADQAMSVPFGKMNLSAPVDAPVDDGATGQFSDAEDEDDEIVEATPSSTEQVEIELEEDLQSDFPSLQAAFTVAYEGSDEEDEEPHVPAPITFTREEQEELKKKSLQPISNSGKMYNSFRKYGNLMKPKEPVKKKPEEPKIEEEKAVTEAPAEASMQSRIIGGMGMSGQENMVEDDGEGWITNTRDLQSMKSQGILDPLRGPSDKAAMPAGPVGPLLTQRSACTTTDFAMQNVILQMNLELLSVDGIKIRRLKSWVSRCGACYKIYTNGTEGPNGMKRMFCAHCGSDMMQRIAASVDSKTGRLRLHMSKKYKNNLRGTKFSLPKAGSGNRFQGDLLLREDQLMMGAWNQKVKMRSGGKSRANAQSIFGKDLASNVGCNAKAVDSDDIRVGFGRRNPNAAKGRERRGKKKKSDGKACGLRRY